MVGCDKLPFDLSDIFHKHAYVDGKCKCGEADPNYVPPHEHTFVEDRCECGEYNTITIAEAIQIALANPTGTTERYYIRATVTTLSNPAYGEMTIEDKTGELYVYGTYSSD
jgi:hypothetical protein